MRERSDEGAPPSHLGGLPEGGHCSDVLGTRQKRRSNSSIRGCRVERRRFPAAHEIANQRCATVRNGARITEVGALA